MIKVLLVDDHPVVIEGLRKVLANTADIDVVGEANNAAEALREAKSRKPDVILLDLRMPGASGIQVARLLREEHSTSAVIILTSYGDHPFSRDVQCSNENPVFVGNHL